MSDNRVFHGAINYRNGPSGAYSQQNHSRSRSRRTTALTAQIGAHFKAAERALVGVLGLWPRFRARLVQVRVRVSFISLIPSCSLAA